MHSVRATARYSRAIHATAELLTKLRLGFAFVGSVARAAWLDDEVDRGSLDVLTLMTPEQKNQVAMMASNRGFRVDRDEIEQSIELDLIPLNFVDEEGDVRVHVLVASNALYGRMVAAACAVSVSAHDCVEKENTTACHPERSRGIWRQGGPLTEPPAPPDPSTDARDDRAVNVIRAEDLALLLAVAEDDDRERLLGLPDFDRYAFNERLRSIGLGTLAVAD